VLTSKGNGKNRVLLFKRMAIKISGNFRGDFQSKVSKETFGPKQDNRIKYTYMNKVVINGQHHYIQQRQAAQFSNTTLIFVSVSLNKYPFLMKEKFLSKNESVVVRW